MSFDTCSSIEH